ncbi:MAG: hypothetical protein HC841_06330 [Verrucomicrobiae bacterium]|nr:hypothetical protein [Verrucomicrobiae bacterium]
MSTDLQDSIVSGPFSTPKTIDILYDDGSFPRWVDISVLDSEATSTVFYLIHSEDRTKEIEKTTYFPEAKVPSELNPRYFPKTGKMLRLQDDSVSKNQKIEQCGSPNPLPPSAPGDR